MRVAAYITAATALASSVIAAPAPGVLKDLGITPEKLNKTISNFTKSSQQECMPAEDAQRVARTFQSIIRGYTKKQALAALTPDFVDYSSAVSIIINKGGSQPEDVTKPVFTSRDEFMEGHGTQEPVSAFSLHHHDKQG